MWPFLHLSSSAGIYISLSGETCLAGGETCLAGGETCLA